MKERIKRLTWLATVVALPMAACDTTGPEGTGEARVILSSAPAAAAVLASAVESGATAGNVSLDDVASIEVTIAGLQAILKSEDEEAGGGWVDLDLTAAATNPIDLMNLPGNGLVIANDGLPAGSYGFLRIFFESATITLVNDVTVGVETFTAAEGPYDLFIPSGAQTGIKIPTVAFEVLEGSMEDVTIEFDASLSVQTIVATPNGLLMSPVLHEGQDGDDEPVA